MKKGKTVSAKEFADWHGISQSRVSQFISDGMPAENSGRQGSEVRINTARGTEWLIERRAKQKNGNEGSERERLYREQADEKALSNARERGELIYRAHVRDAMMHIVNSLCGELDGLAGRLATQLAHKDARVIRGHLLQAHRDVRRGFAESCAQFIIDHGGQDLLAEERVARGVKRPKKRSSKKKRKARAGAA